MKKSLIILSIFIGSACTDFEEYQLIDYSEVPAEFVRERVYSANNRGEYFPLQKTVEIINTSMEEEVVKSAVYDWNFLFQEWSPILKQENEFTGNSLIRTTNSVNYENAWQTFGFNEVEVNTQTHYTYDFTTEQYIEDSRTEVEKDEKDNVVLKTNYDWDENVNAWEKSSLEEFTYDYSISENPIITLISFWNSDINNWVPVERSETENNENGDDTQVLIFRWDEDSETWQLYAQNESTYDNNNNRAEWVLSGWDANQNRWFNSLKLIYRYDSNNEIERLIYQEWSNRRGDWYTIGRYDISRIYER